MIVCTKYRLMLLAFGLLMQNFIFVLLNNCCFSVLDLKEMLCWWTNGCVPSPDSMIVLIERHCLLYFLQRVPLSLGCIFHYLSESLDHYATKMQLLMSGFCTVESCKSVVPFHSVCCSFFDLRCILCWQHCEGSQGSKYFFINDFLLSRMLQNTMT